MNRTGSRSSTVGPGRDEQPRAPVERASRGVSMRLGRLDDRVGLGQPAFADPAAGEIAVARFDEPHAAAPQQRHVGLHGGVLPHVGVHGRRDEHRRPRGQVERGQEVVRDAVGELAEELAVAGATSSRSMLDASAMCSISALSPARTDW